MAIPKISINGLRAFLAVYESQSFSKAADRENATQSGMSTQVKNLELKLGTPLLTRNRKEYALTPAGQLVYRDGQAILRSLMALETALSDMQDEVAGLVRFGLIPSLTRSVLTPALGRFKGDFPKVELSLLEEYSGALLRRVADAELDFAIVPSGDMPPGLTARFVGRDREMIVSSPSALPDHPHLHPAPLSVLVGARLIVPSKSNIRRSRIDTLLSAHGIHCDDLIEMDGMLGTLEMVGQTEWVAILPSAICHADKDGVNRKLNLLTQPPMNFDYVLVQKTENPLPRAAQLLADSVIDHIALLLADWDDLKTPGIEHAELPH